MFPPAELLEAAYPLSVRRPYDLLEFVATKGGGDMGCQQSNPHFLPYINQ